MVHWPGKEITWPCDAHPKRGQASPPAASDVAVLRGIGQRAWRPAPRVCTRQLRVARGWGQPCYGRPWQGCVVLLLHCKPFALCLPTGPEAGKRLLCACESSVCKTSMIRSTDCARTLRA